MNKADLAAEVAQELGCSRADAVCVIDAVVAAISKGVSAEGGVRISGFGSFERRARAGRTIKSPVNGEAIEVKPSTSVAFRPGKKLRDLVR